MFAEAEDLIAGAEDMAAGGGNDGKQAQRGAGDGLVGGGREKRKKSRRKNIYQARHMLPAASASTP